MKKMQRNRGKQRMGKTRDLFKKISDTKEIFHATLGIIKDRKSKDLRETKGKGEKERYTLLNAEFQTIARRDKKALLSLQRNKGKQQNGKG